MTKLVVTPSTGQIIVWRNSKKQDNHPGDGLASVLEQRGYRVTAFKRESEIMQAVLESLPDLLIVYLKTSGEQGYELCKILRQLPRTSGLLIVFVGTRAPFSEMASALRCGGNEYLQLPLDDEECWLRLERHLKTVQLVRSLEAERASLNQTIWSYNHILQQQEAAQISLAKENQALQRLAFTDGLTQVANRSSFNKTIVQMWQQAKDNQQPISLLLCDVDYFKRYNDTYGHLAGDACLQTVADALVRGAHRHGDQVARYGGEEFAILLPATNSQGAQQVAIAVQAALARAQVPHASSLVKPYVSLSMGICTLFPSLGANSGLGDGLHLSYKVLIHGADEALYAAKLQGRDRVIVHRAEGLIPVLSDCCGDSTAANETYPRPAQRQTPESLSAMAKPSNGIAQHTPIPILANAAPLSVLPSVKKLPRWA
jgi:two-component system, chemotaxis family, response regulator WspR